MYKAHSKEFTCNKQSWLVDTCVIFNEVIYISCQMRLDSSWKRIRVTLNTSEELYRCWRVLPGIDLVSLMEKLDKIHPLDTL